MSNLDGLADFLKHHQEMSASIAHLPGVKKHIDELIKWEAAVRAAVSTQKDSDNG